MSKNPILKTIGDPKTPLHREPGLWSVILLFVFIFKELATNLKMILALRKKYKTKKINLDTPHVVVFSDNLDETNGIAINSRLIQGEMKRQGRGYQLMGVAHHTRDTGIVEEGGTILVPQSYSMEQLGYKESETAIPVIKEILNYLDENSVDLIELETPSSGCSLVLLLSKIIGIRAISHYRTDLFFYVDLLVSNGIARWFAKTWCKTFCRLSMPIIVPSTDFEKLIPKQMGILKSQVVRIDRGIHLEKFNPTKNKGIWPVFEKEKGRVKFLYVGRVSQEKEIDFLLDVFTDYKASGGLGELVFVGHGPYLDELKELTKSKDYIQCLGKKVGDDLASYYAEADYFVFPSGSDTFGNVIVEALASGTPSLVSDKGGPKDIVDSKTGWVLAYNNNEAWKKTLLEADTLKLNQEEYKVWTEASLNRSKKFSLEISANHFWEFYRKVLNNEV